MCSRRVSQLYFPTCAHKIEGTSCLVRRNRTAQKSMMLPSTRSFICSIYCIKRGCPVFLRIGNSNSTRALALLYTNLQECIQVASRSLVEKPNKAALGSTHLTFHRFLIHLSEFSLGNGVHGDIPRVGFNTHTPASRGQFKVSASCGRGCAIQKATLEC